MEKIKHVKRAWREPLRVLVLPVGRDGCSFYRVLQPYRRLAQRDDVDVIEAKNGELDSDAFMDNIARADVIIAKDMHKEILLDLIYPNFETKDKKIVLDFDDDLFDITPYDHIYRWHGTQEVNHRDGNGKILPLWKDGENDFDIERNKKRLETTKKLMRKVDLITTTTEKLRSRFLEYNDNVEVVPNALNFNLWKKYPLKKKGLRIGWTGGSTHYADWIEMKDAITNIMKKYPDATLVLAGATWGGIYKDIPRERVEIYPWVDIDAHPFRTALFNLDIAIIPLGDNSFNSYKSCLKWYEFARLGVPCLTSHVSPYKEEMLHKKNCWMYDTPEDMESMFDVLANNKKERNDIAKEANKWVTEHRDLETINEDLHKLLTK